MQQNDELLPFERVKMMKLFLYLVKCLMNEGDAWINMPLFSYLTLTVLHEKNTLKISHEKT